ncbi:MAG: hypothetical protein ACW98Y_18025, partial [Candidatus Thorarchaeota archaeon]
SRILPHCARGPKRCDKCAEAAKEIVHCIVRVFDGHGMMTRPVLELERDGEKSFYEYDMIKRFSNLEEAKSYARENGLDYRATD